MLTGMIQTIILIGFLVLIVLYISFIGRKDKRSIRKLHKYTIGLGIVLFAITIPNIIDAYSYEGKLLQVINDGEVELGLMRTDAGNFLYHKETRTPVDYKIRWDGGETDLERSKQPVYLRDLGDYYAVIYSSNLEKTYEYGRFLFGDYEMNNPDELYIIEKETGYTFDTEEYEMIGLEINLNNIITNHELFIFEVYLPHENNISHLRVYRHTEDYNVEDLSYSSRNYNSDYFSGGSLPLIHIHTPGDPSEIIEFELEGIYFHIKDSYNRDYYGYYYVTEYSISLITYEDLNVGEIVVDDCVKVTENGIYYLETPNMLHRKYRSADYQVGVILGSSHFLEAVEEDLNDTN